MHLDYDAIVIGSGLAGLSAAFELAQRGHRVLVLEAEKQVGGRTSNWKDGSMDVESGVHKFVGVYRELPRLLKRACIELDQVFVYLDEIEIRVAAGGDRNHAPGQPLRSGRFGTSLLYRPLLTLGGALGNPLLQLILCRVHAADNLGDDFADQDTDRDGYGCGLEDVGRTSR